MRVNIPDRKKKSFQYQVCESQYSTQAYEFKWHIRATTTWLVYTYHVIFFKVILADDDSGVRDPTGARHFLCRRRRRFWSLLPLDVLHLLTCSHRSRACRGAGPRSWLWLLKSRIEIIRIATTQNVEDLCEFAYLLQKGVYGKLGSRRPEHCLGLIDNPRRP